MQNKRRFLWQALLMTGVSLLLRSVGVSAQVIIASRIGAEAVGISSLIGGVYGFAVTLALSGIQFGTTRQMAECLGRGDLPMAHQTMRCCIAHALGFGLFSGSILFLGAPQIAQIWLRDLRTVTSLRIMALTLPAVSLAVCFSGYFVAVRRVYKSATVQVMEEILRVGLTLALLGRMVSGGLEYALLALALGGMMADLFSGLVLYLLYRHDRRRYLALPPSHAPLPPFAATARRLLALTLPVAVAAYARSGLITLEHMLIPIGLQSFGQTHAEALSSYGMVQSMALPVLLFPCALTGAFAGLFVPELTEAHVRGEWVRIRYMMERVFSLTLLYAIGASGLMIAFSYELGMALYDSREAAEFIRLLAPLIPVMYLDSATDAMLKGLGQQVYSMKVNIIDALISVLLVWVLTPRMGIMGYVVTIYVTELLNAALSIVRLFNVISPRPRIVAWVITPLVSIVAATSLTRLVYALMPAALTPVGHGGAVILFVVLALLLYALFLVVLGAVRREQIRWIGSFFVEQ
jgi:stage V sporulation protein B